MRIARQTYNSSKIKLEYCKMLKQIRLKQISSLFYNTSKKAQGAKGVELLLSKNFQITSTGKPIIIEWKLIIHEKKEKIIFLINFIVKLSINKGQVFLSKFEVDFKNFLSKSFFMLILVVGSWYLPSAKQCKCSFGCKLLVS